MPLESTEMPDHVARAWFTGMVARRWSADFALLPGRVVRETGAPGGSQTITFLPPGRIVTGTLLYRGGRCVCGWWDADGVVDGPEPEDMYLVAGRRALELAA